MKYSQNDLLKDFKSGGVKSGISLVVHSSLKSIGYVEGGAEAVINALRDAVGDNGTLLFPTLTGKKSDSPKCLPVFDVRNTPCWTGLIPETARKIPGGIRSLNPTHSVYALGCNKEFFTKEHILSKSPCDAHSPYYKNAENAGYIILIGVDCNSNTSIHSCEEIAEVPYHLQKYPANIFITGYNGEKIKITNYLHDWFEPATNFNKFEDLFIQKKIMKMIKVGDAEVRLINAKDMFDFAVDLLRKEPYFLLVDHK